MSTERTAPARPFGAVGTAMVTPFSADGESIDLDAAQRLAVHLRDHGHDLLVLNGTTGESPTTSGEEKLALVRAVREAVGPDMTLIAGVGSNDTRKSVRVVRDHAELGIDGLLVVTPYYSKPSQEGIIAHVEAIAAASDLPVMLYDIPGRTGVPLSRETILHLAENPSVLALKDAKGDLLESALVMAQSDLAYYSGEDALNLPWLAIGASGLVSVIGHVAGDLLAELVEAVDAGDIPRAQELHGRLAAVTEAIFGLMPGVVAAKTALHLQGVLPHAAVRGPHSPASEAQSRALAQALDAVPGIAPLH